MQHGGHPYGAFVKKTFEIRLNVVAYYKLKLHMWVGLMISVQRLYSGTSKFVGLKRRLCLYFNVFK